MVQRQADIWREKAVDALERAEAYLTRLLRMAAHLVRLQAIHVPDDYAHCKTCAVPFPCETAVVLRLIADNVEEAGKADG